MTLRSLARLLLPLLFVLTQAAPARADWLWDLHQRADQLAAVGRIDDVIPLWDRLAEGYSRRQSWTNAALYWKRLGRALVGSAAEPPYALRYDFAPHAGRVVRLTMRAYNSQRQVEGERSLRLAVGAPTATGFWDMSGHWARGPVEDLAALGIKLLVVAKGLDTPPSAERTFPDVARERWSHPFVEAAVAAAIITRDDLGGGAFDPERPVSRQEMATWIVRALGLWKEAEFERHPVTFTDVAAIAAGKDGYGAIAARQGIITGFPDGSFGPAQNATRAQAAVMIQRLLATKSNYMEGIPVHNGELKGGKSYYTGG